MFTIKIILQLLEKMFEEPFNNEINISSILAEKLDTLVEIYKKKLIAALESENKTNKT